LRRDPAVSGCDLVGRPTPWSRTHSSPRTPETIGWRAGGERWQGAQPLYYVMALALPDTPTDEWMMRFSSGLKDAQDRYGSC
jgi:thiamine monophosphate kinase